MNKIISTELAYRAGVTKKTLRHYESIGLLEPLKDETNGYWYYDIEDLKKIALIQYMKLMGYNLSEMKQLFDTEFAGLLETIEVKKLQLDKQINALKEAKNFLNMLTGKTRLPMDEAIRNIMEEDHLSWFKESLTVEEYQRVEALMSSEEAYEDHIRMIESMRSYKQASLDNKVTFIEKSLKDIRMIFNKAGISDSAMVTTLRIILISGLDGPAYNRILEEDEIEAFLSMVSEDNKAFE